MVPKKRRGKATTDAVPAKLTACQKAVLDKIILKEFRITFHREESHPQRPGNVPEQHQTKFGQIQQLGQMKYDSYVVQPRPDSTDNRPWELENKLRAKRLSQKATQAIETCQNEDGWRMTLENHVFQRFENEVAWYETSISTCFKCRMLIGG